MVQAAQAREDREENVRQRLANGELGLDIYGLREKLKALGVTYVEQKTVKVES